jgi:uncharacterized protein YbaP (TraB family)
LSAASRIEASRLKCEKKIARQVVKQAKKEGEKIKEVSGAAKNLKMLKVSWCYVILKPEM